MEIQVQKKLGFAKRVTYYTSKAYVGQLEKGDDYPKLNQVIFIGITNFDVFEDDKYLTRHLILNTSTHKQELKDLEFNFIELTKFDKEEKDLKTIEDKWIYFIKNAGDLKLIPKNADFTELQDAYETANTMLWSKEELDVYDYWLMREQDERGAVEYSFLEGKDEGKREGLIEGERKGLIDGKREGLIEGKREGLIEGIEIALESKYGEDAVALINSVKRISSIEDLETLKNMIKGAASLEEIKTYFISIV
ncbi:transposase [Candidatus Magnetoovum chiemensis]|nr:transposase [Candidatus Magnetoovum chiemensis]